MQHGYIWQSEIKTFVFSAFGHNECPDPGIPINARRFGDNFQLGSSISVICEDGFIKTQGAKTITCELDNGKVMWSGPIPKCEGKYCACVCVRAHVCTCARPYMHNFGGK